MYTEIPARATLGLQRRLTPMTGVKQLGAVTLTVIISACAVAGCGGGSKSTPATPSSAASTSPNATTGAYRKALERGATTLSSDLSAFASCTITFTAPGCRTWAVADKSLIQQFMQLLRAPQVPTGDANDDAALRRLLHRISDSDVALVKAINAGNGNSSAVQALTAKIKASVEHLNPILNRLDPGLELNVPA